MAITDWPLQERPRERLFALGAGSLADAELLAILLRTGVKGKSAVDVARQLLGRFGSVAALLEAGSGSLAETPGLGSAKLAQLQAALELARRALKEEISSRDALSSPRAVRDYLRLALAGREQEVFVVLLLDAQHRVTASEELFRGTLTQTSVYPREVVKCALKHNAAAVIFAHNHPSGVAEPSHADEILTRSLKAALALVDIQVLDHFIVAGSRTMSFAERGHHVSHANNKTIRRFYPNLQYRRFWVESEKRWVRLRISNAGVRIIDKKGIEAVLKELRERGEI